MLVIVAFSVACLQVGLPGFVQVTVVPKHGLLRWQMLNLSLSSTVVLEFSMTLILVA